MNLDMETLYVEARAEAFRGGKKRFYENRVSELNCAEKDGRPQITAQVTGTNGARRVAIWFDKTGGLYDYACDCGEPLETGPCRHIVAAALAYEDKFPLQSADKNAKPALKTDAAVFGLSTEYAKKHRSRRARPAEAEVTLAPILGIYAESRFYLRFTAARERQYKIKDVSDFAAAYQKGAYRRFGADLEFTVESQNFDPQSRRLAEFLVTSYREKIFFAAQNGQKVSRRDELPLSADDTDEFFSLYAGRLVAFDGRAQTVKDKTADAADTRLFEKETDNLNATVSVEQIPEGFVIVSDWPKARFIYGKRFRYFLTESRVYRVTPGFADAVWPLFQALSVNGKLFVLEKDMPLFYNNVLCPLAGCVTVDAHGADLERFEAAPFSATLTLFARPSGGIEGKLSARYDDAPVDLADDNSAPAGVVRDFEAERALNESLTRFFPRYPELTLTGEEEIYRFLKEGAADLAVYADLEMAEDVRRYRLKRPPRFRVGVRLEGGLLKASLDADEYAETELKEILSAHREKRAYIRLADGSFVDLSDPSIAALGEFFSGTGREWSDELTLPAFYAPFLDNEFKNGMFLYERDASFKTLVKTLQTASAAETRVPPAVKDVLRNYQKAGFRWLKALSDASFGGILADDMGLGKSLQIISLLLSDRGGTNLIVCPTSLILNWENEFKKFAPELKTLPVLGNLAERKGLLTQAENADVIITSYELLRRDTELYGAFNFRYAVLDEAQYIKNPETRNARTVKTIKAEHRFALTGTPIENSLSELWSIFDFIMPGYLLRYPQFRTRYESEIARGSDAAAEQFKKLVAPFILRRLKTEVLSELPPKIETDVVSPLEGDQDKLYRANVRLVRDSAAQSADKPNKIAILSMLTKLRQICCDPALVYPDYAGNSAKFDTCLDLVRSAVSGGHKVLLFSQFTQMIERFRRVFNAEGITHYVLKGDTVKTERMRLVNKFNADATNVFLISLKAGGTGLNLTGADVVIHYDPWWNESVTHQATDRAYRIGQVKPVQVYKLVLKDTVEQQILELQKKKTALSELVIGGGGVGIPGYEELMRLLAAEPV